jgi:hypothetical protein
MVIKNLKLHVEGGHFIVNFFNFNFKILFFEHGIVVKIHVAKRSHQFFLCKIQI